MPAWTPTLVTVFVAVDALLLVAIVVVRAVMSFRRTCRTEGAR